MGCLSKDRLIFNATDLAESDQVAAHLYAGSTALSTTHVGSKDGLDVNIINPIAVDLNGIYDVSANPTPDNVGVIAHTRNATPGAAQQVERTTAAAPTADGVVAANVHALDVNSFLMGFNGTTFDRLASVSSALKVYLDGVNGSLNVNATLSDLLADDAVDAGGSLKVGSKVQPVTLTAVSAAGDRADLASDKYRRVHINDSCNIAAKPFSPVVTNTATQFAVTAQVGRKRLIIQNLSDKDIFLGVSNALTTANGLRIAKGATFDENWGEGLPIWLIAATGITSDVRGFEIA